jgi:hypothetical protein
MKITVRPTPDPEGRLVDVITWPEFITGVCLTREYKRSEIQSQVAESLLEVAASTVKRLRGRSLMVYLGHCVLDDGKSVTVVGLPYPVASDVFRVVRRGLDSLGILEVETVLPADVYAVPLFRYRAGETVTYYSPFDPRENSFLGGGFEIRSYEIRDRPQHMEEALPCPAVEVGNLHSMSAWSQSRDTIMQFIFDIRGPGSFRSLQRRIEDYFGISVHCRPAAELHLFGRIETGWLREDLTTTVRICIRDDLSHRQRYAVLAHELAHYFFHFPLLLIGQMVEQAAWDAPGISVVWHRVRRRVLGDLEDWIEAQATSLAVNFIIPAQVRPERIAEMVMEKRRRITAEEVTWRLLQPYFPETSGRTYSWRNYEFMLEQMNADLDLVRADDGGDHGTLFYQFLAAALRHQSPEFQRRNHALEFRIERLTLQMLEYLAVRRRNPTGSPLDATTTIGRELGQEKTVYPPLEPRAGNQPVRYVPLVAVPSSPGHYVDPRHTHDASGLSTWRARYPASPVITYPYADMPDMPLWSFEDA